MTTAADIDLTPPENTLDRQTVRYLHENFSRIKLLLDVLTDGAGVNGTFTTTDGKTVTVVNGIITEIV